LRVYAWVFSDDSQNAARVACPFTRKLCRAVEILVAPTFQIPVLAYRVVEGGIGLWLVLCLVELPCFPNEARAFLLDWTDDKTIFWRHIVCITIFKLKEYLASTLMPFLS
jgi:hypothetical protein